MAEDMRGCLQRYEGQTFDSSSGAPEIFDDVRELSPMSLSSYMDIIDV
jgi:hypothetical protein